MKIGQKSSLQIDTVKPQGKNSKASKTAAGRAEDKITLENSAELSKVLDIITKGSGSESAEEIRQVEALKPASSNSSPMEQVAQGLLDDTAILQALLGGDVL